MGGGWQERMTERISRRTQKEPVTCATSRIGMGLSVDEKETFYKSQIKLSSIEYF